MSENDHRDQHLVRKQKLAEWREKGCAYPLAELPTHFAGTLHATYDDQSTLPKDAVHLSGRIMTRRVMGKASFTHIQDGTGRIQIYIREEMVSESVYDEFKHWDLGDIISVKGTLFITKRGELTIEAQSVSLLSKCLYALPDKFHGLVDHEIKYRQRYLDILVNEESRKVFQLRASLIAYMRQFFNEKGYMEVETPMLHDICGGATAKPFVTHHQSLHLDLFLRIAPELFLKRLVIGGFDRVFEINRCFRNEGLSTKHNPEFTSLEFYQAYTQYETLMDMTETLFRLLAEHLLGTTTLTYQDDTVDLGQPFERYTMSEALLKYNSNLSSDMLESSAPLLQYMKDQGMEYDGDQSDWGIMQNYLFEKTVEAKLIKPTFITRFPVAVSPLARRCDDHEGYVDRFELFVSGRELANGFNELNDPEDQAERFKEQVRQKDLGDEEAMGYDADYIQALSYGLPPTAGEGIGIDRLVMLFANQPNIRDVILFPQLKPSVAAKEALAD